MESFDLTVIGSGPGGYVAAIRAAQLGMRAAIVERDRLGGVCLNWGCIPTKALLKIAEQHEFLKHAGDWGFQLPKIDIEWPKVIGRSRAAAEKLSKGVSGLMKKNQITVLSGAGRFLGANRIAVHGPDKVVEVATTRSIIATGARASTIPGVTLDGRKVISSKEAMVLEEIPRSMAIIGAGAIGAEFAYFYAAFGTEVTLLEYFDRILPASDEDVSKHVERSFKKRGMKIHTSARVKEVSVTRGGATRTVFVKDGAETTVEADIVLVAVGVRGNVEEIGLEALGIGVEKTFVKVDDDLRTQVEGIYAIGDVCGPPALAHVASAEGVHAVEHLTGLNPRPIDYPSIPACIYCHPQVASVGLNEKEAREQGFQVKVGRFPFTANGKSVAIGETEGFVKIIGDERHGEILGAHIFGADATELIAEIALAKATEMTVDDLHHTVHSHPTLSESVMEAAGDWKGEAVQM